MNTWLSSIDSRCSYSVSQVWAFMFVVQCSYIELSRSKLHKTGDLQVGNWHVNCQHSSLFLLFVAFHRKCMCPFVTIPNKCNRTLVMLKNTATRPDRKNIVVQCQHTAKLMLSKQEAQLSHRARATRSTSWNLNKLLTAVRNITMEKA